ncbi:MAG: hypothetical protein Ct9H300mP22_6750 [Gammaproteobacteria bacterium]|nr:MAG: hypothetical protein Ct9H300mP22_6750 [Gammaproteobacteria bacterium]
MFEFGFIGGSMGAVVGEKFTQGLTLHCRKLTTYLLLNQWWSPYAGSFSFPHAMAKTSAALEKLKQQGLPYISVLVDPV